MVVVEMVVIVVMMVVFVMAMVVPTEDTSRLILLNKLGVV